MAYAYPGDSVKILKGTHAGKTGVVVAEDPSQEIPLEVEVEGHIVLLTPEEVA